VTAGEEVVMLRSRIAAAALAATAALAPALAEPQSTVDTLKGAVQQIAALDLNTASLSQLASLPGVGDALAKKIVEARPFKQANELVSKNVLTQQAFDAIKDMVVVK
jgi:DNA uptake protein ComE-like DNA-binding protein